MPETYPIRHDFHAVHSSGVVPARSKKLIVLHDMEGGTAHGAAESTGSWFQNYASGGSTQYGCDDDSIQQYLDLCAVAWGAPYANQQGVHIEQFGFAHWSKEEWLRHPGTLDRCAFLIARIGHVCGIPVRGISDGQLRRGMRGVTTHAQCTRVFGGTHTDPGPHYPFDYVIKLAKEHAKAF